MLHVQQCKTHVLQAYPNQGANQASNQGPHEGTELQPDSETHSEPKLEPDGEPDGEPERQPDGEPEHQSDGEPHRAADHGPIDDVAHRRTLRNTDEETDCQHNERGRGRARRADIGGVPPLIALF